MFVKLPTKDETKEMYFITAIAIEVIEKDISILFQNKKYLQIPKYLKRIKKENGKILFLLGNNLNLKNIKNPIIVTIPGFEPLTLLQFKKANSIWPCYFFKIKDDFIDMDLVNYNFNIFKNTFKLRSNDIIDCQCSNFCMIFNNNINITESIDQEYILGHGILKIITSISKMNKIGYLCTGMSAYLYNEPCLSCAMALVHGRIKNVFCYKKRLIKGSFSNFFINYNKSLNHRYNVYFYYESKV